MRVHILKCWPSSFRALRSGEKKHEVRKDDRDYAVGDFLNLLEWQPTPLAEHCAAGWYAPIPDKGGGNCTGQSMWFRVTYKTPGGSWGLPADVCVLSVEPCEEPSK